MSEHTEHADRLEQDADHLAERSADLGEEISDVREDWEHKKRDPEVPGAAGNPEAAERELPPEANYTTRGGEDN